ncbi:Hypothetical protein FKW44_009667, partial [Caligus rogercresseyi]
MGCSKQTIANAIIKDLAKVRTEEAQDDLDGGDQGVQEGQSANLKHETAGLL